MVNKWLMAQREACRPRLDDAPLDRESLAGGAHVVSVKVPEERLAGIVGRSPPRPPSRNGAWRHSFSAAHADQNEQPYAVSEAFVASRVCLQVASMVAFADGFLAKSTHALRV